MNKEDKVLDVINNMTEYNKSKDIQSKLFFNMSLHSLVRTTFKALSELIRDVQTKRTTQDVVKEILKPDRLVYERKKTFIEDKKNNDQYKFYEIQLCYYSNFYSDYI